MEQHKKRTLADTKTKPTTQAARTDASEPVNQQEIAVLAYQLWLKRGCPSGSPEHDWFRAERQLQARLKRTNTNTKNRSPRS
jgi:hypothetical protein